MVRTDFFQRLIRRRDADHLLRTFLEATLCILPEALLDNTLSLSKKLRSNEVARGIIALVEVDSTDNRLKRIGENILPRTPHIL